MLLSPFSFFVHEAGRGVLDFGCERAFTARDCSEIAEKARITRTQQRQKAFWERQKAMTQFEAGGTRRLEQFPKAFLREIRLVREIVAVPFGKAPTAEKISGRHEEPRRIARSFSC